METPAPSTAATPRPTVRTHGGERRDLQRRQRLHANGHLPGGQLQGQNPVVCAALDECHQIGSCDSSSGACLNPLQPVGTTCAGSNVCDASGACVQCLTASTCPGTDDGCAVRTCSAGTCGMAYAPNGTSCGTDLECDGNGACAGAGVPHVVVNEVESNGGTPGDWVELYNATPRLIDLSGFVFKQRRHARLPANAGTTMAPGAYLTRKSGVWLRLGARIRALFDKWRGRRIAYWAEHATTLRTQPERQAVRYLHQRDQSVARMRWNGE